MPSPRPRSEITRKGNFTTPLTFAGGTQATTEAVQDLPESLMLPVWHALRSVLLWAAEEPAMRAGLFEPCAMAEWEAGLLAAEWEPDLRGPLVVLVGELAKPGEASPSNIAQTCMCVTEWALTHNFIATGLAFAEAAALSWTEQPRYAWVAGSLLQRNGRLREAEKWLRRAAKVSTTAHDRETQTLSQHRLGIVLRDLQNYPHALRTLNTALRLARRHNMRLQEAEILHDLFVVTVLSGHPAEEYAQDALDIYGNGHPRVPALAHDVASLCLLKGCHSHALAILRQLSPRIESPEERSQVLATLAWAAGECCEYPTFRTAADEARQLFDSGNVPRSAVALLGLAVGAQRLAAWNDAEQAAREARDAAARAGDSILAVRAEEVLAAIQDRRTNAGSRIAVADAVHTTVPKSLVSGLLSALSEGR